MTCTSLRLGLCILLVGIAATGCAENSYFNLMLDLPVNDTEEEVFAFVQARPTDGNYQHGDVHWIADADPDGELLDRALPTRTGYSYRGNKREGGLLLNVRFCGTPRCTDVGSDLNVRREFQVAFERTFYSGHQTFYDLRIDTIPERPAIPGPDTPSGAVHHEYVPMCQIRGCTDGELYDYCEGSGDFNRRHPCEN